MPPISRKFYACVLCDKRTKPGERRPINDALSTFLKKHFLLQIRPNSGDVVCDKCRRRHYRNEEQKSKTTDVTAEPALDDFVPPAPKPRKCTLSSPPSVKLSLSSTAKSHSYCFLCKRPGPKLVNVPPKARFSTFLHNEIIIPAGSRCCPVHLHEDLFTDEAISSVRCTNHHITLNLTSIRNLLKN